MIFDRDSRHPCYVYALRNKVNQRFYIGISNNPERRFKEHMKRPNALLAEDVDRVLLEYSKGVPPKKMKWLPVHWAQAYKVIKKHKNKT